jgi:hypothetical protein
MEQLPDDDNDGHFPNNWAKVNDVISLIRRRLGCSTCTSAGKIGPMETQCLKVANELIEGSVKECGDTHTHTK